MTPLAIGVTLVAALAVIAVGATLAFLDVRSRVGAALLAVGFGTVVYLCVDTDLVPILTGTRPPSPAPSEAP